MYLLEIESINLKFINTSCFINGDEYDVAKMHELSFERYYFPLKYPFYIFCNYQGVIPDLEYFLDFTDTSEIKKDKQNFVKLFHQNKWNYQKELLIFVNQKAELFIHSFTKFIKNCFELQTNLKCDLRADNPNFLKVVHPFAHNICTFPSFIYKVFKAFYLINENIFTIHKEFGLSTRKTTNAEYQWAMFKEFLNPNENWRHSFNHPLGQKYFKECIPDLYNEEKGEAEFFCGCYFHGHLENCKINKKAQPNQICFQNKTFQELNTELETKLTNLLKNNPQVQSAKVTWECLFKFETKKTKKYKKFLRNFYYPHPLIRLKPRATIRGAYLDAFNLFWSQDKFPEESFFCLDVNGLYSYCAIKYPSFVGKYEILIGKILSKVEIKNNLLFLENKKIQGTILVSILPPKDLNYPFLHYRLKSGKSVLTFCRKCLEINNR